MPLCIYYFLQEQGKDESNSHGIELCKLKSSFYLIPVLVGVLNTWFVSFIHLFIDLNIEYLLFSS